MGRLPLPPSPYLLGDFPSLLLRSCPQINLTFLTLKKKKRKKERKEKEKKKQRFQGQER